jgi:hypothetical protein
MLSAVLRQERPAVRERPALSSADSIACTKRGGDGDCFQPLRECEDVNRLSTRRAGRSQGIGEGGSPQEGASQALAEARTAHQGGRRASVALRRCDLLRARLQSEVCGWPIALPITLSCEEVSQPGGCSHLAKRSGWRRRVSAQDIRPRWHAGHTSAGWSSAGGAWVSGGTGRAALLGC